MTGADGTAGAAAISQPLGLGGSPSGTRGASAEAASAPAERAKDAFEHALDSFRDGFAQVITDGRQDVGEGLRDSRLMLQLGMLLGFVYVGFLSVWFWATRLRQTNRSDAT
jgi:hypothetical protein